MAAQTAFQVPAPPFESVHHLHRNEQNARVFPFSSARGHRPTHRQPISRRRLLRNLLAAAHPLLPTAVLASVTNPYFDKYDKYASTYETLDGTTLLANKLGFTRLRGKLLAQAKGDVLELGVGTGINLPLYHYDRVSSVTGLDFSQEMLAFARQKVDSAELNQRHIRLLQGRVEDIRLPDDSFDTVIDTFSLCVFPDPIKALLEMKRVLRKAPESTVLLLEHTLSRIPLLATYQNLTAEPTAALSKGCFPNQNVLQMVKKVGFSVRRHEYLLADTVIYLELRV